MLEVAEIWKLFNHNKGKGMTMGIHTRKVGKIRRWNGGEDHQETREPRSWKEKNANIIKNEVLSSSGQEGMHQAPTSQMNDRMTKRPLTVRNKEG